MAKIELTRREVRNDAFPALCLSCGSPASDHVSKTFRWMPWWRPVVAVVLGVILVPFGLIPIVGRRLYRETLQGLATPREMPARVPLCAAHRNHWRWRAAVSWGGLVALGAIVVVAEVLFYLPTSPLRGARWFPGQGAFFAGIGIGFLAWLAGLAFIDLTAIQAVTIMDDGIALRGVSPTFVEGLLRDRQERPSAPGPAPDEPEGPPRFRVVAIPADGAPADGVAAAFKDRETARGYAQFLRDSGSYRRVDVEEIPS
jgi:hypothetical protein